MTNRTASNGVSIPQFMYGTAWKGASTTQLVALAVDSGFTAIDTANQLVHYNEALVGRALEKLAANGVARDTLFLQTKFTPADGQDHRKPYDPSAPVGTQVAQSFESSLQHLQTGYVDSYVLHGPYSRTGLGDSDWEVWAAIEDIYHSGQARMIGVSNLNATQLRLLCEKARVKPMVVQNRCYAIFGWDREVRDLCQEHNIIYQGFSLLTANVAILSNPAIVDLARKFDVGPAQIVFRFAMQIGMVPLTGTTNEQHMREDLRVDRFELSSDDVGHIETIAG